MTPFRAQRIWERNVLVYRRLWKIIFTGFFEPVLYLFSIGIGIGALVGEVTLADGQTIPYAAFVAPALMATSAMNGAVLESTMNIFFRLNFDNVYQGMLTTPLVPRDIAIGEIGWSLLRGFVYSVVFLVVMALMGYTTSWWAILTIPGAVLIGFAFGAVGMASATLMRSWQDLDLVALVTVPLFLFSATFYPIEVYPPVLQWAARLSPLYHGTEMLRSFSLGVFDWTLLVHVGYLLAMGVVGSLLTGRRLDGMLRK
jgi:lipooligosaccharide transport system permease protein